VIRWPWYWTATVTDEAMQSFARWTNLSNHVLLPPTGPADYRVPLHLHASGELPLPATTLGSAPGCSGREANKPA
jgi:predicted PhzF superfamily epimerase YddE/YHI9